MFNLTPPSWTKCDTINDFMRLDTVFFMYAVKYYDILFVNWCTFMNIIVSYCDEYFNQIMFWFAH